MEIDMSMTIKYVAIVFIIMFSSITLAENMIQEQYVGTVSTDNNADPQIAVTTNIHLAVAEMPPTVELPYYDEETYSVPSGSNGTSNYGASNCPYTQFAPLGCTNNCGGEDPLDCSSVAASIAQVGLLMLPTNEIYRDFFKKACVAHDYCYRHGDITYRYTKDKCDEKFHEDMLTLCGSLSTWESGQLTAESLGVPCSIAAYLYYGAVQELAASSYKSGSASTCCQYEGADIAISISCGGEANPLAPQTTLPSFSRPLPSKICISKDDCPGGWCINSKCVAKMPRCGEICHYQGGRCTLVINVDSRLIIKGRCRPLSQHEIEAGYECRCLF